MEGIYFNLVKAHRRTCDPSKATPKKKLVPEDCIEAVKQMLTEAGYDHDGNKIDE